jgi:hypothetical protein
MQYFSFYSLGQSLLVALATGPLQPLKYGCCADAGVPTLRPLQPLINNLLCWCRVAGVPAPRLLQPLLQVCQRQSHPGDLRQRPLVQRGHCSQRCRFSHILVAGGGTKWNKDLTSSRIFLFPSRGGCLFTHISLNYANYLYTMLTLSNIIGHLERYTCMRLFTSILLDISGPLIPGPLIKEKYEFAKIFEHAEIFL